MKYAKISKLRTETITLPDTGEVVEQLIPPTIEEIIVLPEDCEPEKVLTTDQLVDFVRVDDDAEVGYFKNREGKFIKPYDPKVPGLIIVTDTGSFEAPARPLPTGIL